LIWAFAEGCPCHSPIMYKGAALYGHLDVMKWASVNGFKFFESTTRAAARGGHMEVLKWLRSKYCTWGGVVEAAAEGGHLEVMKWLRSIGAQWNDTCTAAARGGHLEILIWAIGEGCPYVNNGSKMGVAAAQGGHLEVLKWLRDHGYDIMHTSGFAAIGGHLGVLKWLRNHGFPFGDEICQQAAACGHLEVMKWLRSPEMNAPWGLYSGWDTCTAAAKGGHLEVILWAIKNDCPYRPSRICENAASHGHLDVLKRIVPLWGAITDWEAIMDNAAEGGHVVTVQWAIAKGAIAKGGRTTRTCAQYLARAREIQVSNNAERDYDF